jgi:hypothetical protein
VIRRRRLWIKKMAMKTSILLEPPNMLPQAQDQRLIMWYVSSEILMTLDFMLLTANCIFACRLPQNEKAKERILTRRD